ncbi:MAG: hypothetical protein JW913_17325 [Chitinispirillaceae bacterium]|nr:hypothetical protein [Chitinispirillaceae bacterium]
MRTSRQPVRSRWSSAVRPVVIGCIALGATIGCAPWPTRFEEIDDHRPRVLDFVYQKYSTANPSDTSLCEAAPGDTVLVKAYFAGQPLVEQQWRVSFNVQISSVGQDTALDIEPLIEIPLPPALPRDSCFSDSTLVVIKAFQIPRYVISSNPMIANAIAPATVSLGIPNPQLLLTLIDSLSHIPPGERQAFIGSLNALLAPTGSMVFPSYDSLSTQLGPMLQYLSVPIRLFVAVNDVHEIRSDFYVRYNSRFTDIPGLFANHNPRIRCLAIYKVKGTAKPGFAPGDLSATDTTFCLYLDSAAATNPDPAIFGHNVRFTDTVLIDEGYSYFAIIDTGVFRGVSQLDSAATLLESNGISTILGYSKEDFFVQWFYDYLDAEAYSIGVNDRLIIAGGSPLATLLPPRDDRIRTIRLWAQLYDSFLGESMRPFGSTLREAKLHFEYSPAYLKSMKR